MSDSVNSAHFRNRDTSKKTDKSSPSPSSSPSKTKNGNKSKSSTVTEKDVKMKAKVSSPKRILYLVLLAFISWLAWTFLFGGSGGSLGTPEHSVNWWDENVYLPLGLQKKSYAVIIDAGSTGSRVLAFAFHQRLSDRNLKLKDEIFVEVKPGLSSYAETPLEAAKSLQVLLEKAQAFIPKEEWSSTPISLKATAGLRLLPKEKAEGILDAVTNIINKSGFRTTPDSVGIMDGVDEGIFSWFTVNFLLDRIGGRVSKTVAALDLGGGSTQITVASTPETLSLYPSEDVQNISLFHQHVPLYTHSYLGLGLQSVRKAVLSHNQSDQNSLVLESPCVNPKVSREWTHGGVTYTVKGIPNNKFQKVQYDGFARKEPVADWDACYKIIVKIIEEKNTIKSRDLNRQIVVFSYFTERAAEAGLVDPTNGGKLTLQHYFDAARIACNTVNADLPLLCLDLGYMGALLHNGYGLAKHTPIMALKKVDGHEISWALGAAYHILQNGS